LALPIVRNDPRDHHRGLDIMRWGLVPFWAKEVKIGYSTFNARAVRRSTPSRLSVTPNGAGAA